MLLDQIISHPPNSDAPAKLVSEAAQGNKAAVAELLVKHPDWVRKADIQLIIIIVMMILVIMQAQVEREKL